MQSSFSRRSILYLLRSSLTRLARNGRNTACLRPSMAKASDWHKVVPAQEKTVARTSEQTERKQVVELSQPAGSGAFFGHIVTPIRAAGRPASLASSIICNSEATRHSFANFCISEHTRVSDTERYHNNNFASSDTGMIRTTSTKLLAVDGGALVPLVHYKMKVGLH
jgi:hypothetical protein